MLLSAEALGDRRRLVAGALAPLAESLAHDLERLALTPELYVPERKARLTRSGGRCPRCGAPLAFDPWNPARHRCLTCSIELSGDDHDGMWIMWYQLWLAERATHAAALYATRGDRQHRALAVRILARYAERYLTYPNRDNVLGPTRVFFSTYLESLWLLQLVCALDLLEACAPDAELGGHVREQLIRPSSTLIAQYDEGLSNRQVWNNAALMAGGLALGDRALVERAVQGASGLLVHLERALLADGTWYEGENYHLFAHRGLWYGVTLAEQAGFEVPEELRARYRRAFETPFLTALPDFTFPSRRDSQYRVSLRQWRIAESCELGLADSDSTILRGALSELYRGDVTRGDTGRACSTSEAERNVAAGRLTRADLSWKALLFATEAPLADDVAAPAPASVLLPDQGFAVLRRDRGRTYAALDYGTSGGGHGHPDRLNLWLVVGEARFLEDVGTGSYVDPSLHWYRSTLAHNAPLADGHSQMRIDGELLAWSERDPFGWTLARARIAPNVEAERAIVVASDYAIDELSWTGASITTLDLPFHVQGSAPGITAWTDAAMRGGDAVEDGFSYLEGGVHSAPITGVTIAGVDGTRPLTLRIAADAPFVLWRVRGPGPPNAGTRDFFVLRSVGKKGRVRTVLDWTDSVTDVASHDDQLVVSRRDGTRHTHVRRENEWQIHTGRALVALGGGALKAPSAEPPPAAARPPSPLRIPQLPTVDDRPGSIAAGSVPALRFEIGADHYRRSEQTWDEAGRPGASVAFAATAHQLHIDISVLKTPVVFAPRRSYNPLDNEHPDINSDGVQLYVGPWSWLLVPEEPLPNVRVVPRQESAAASAPLATWRLTPGGYALRVALPRTPLATLGRMLPVDVIVNEITADRERRRGQLVLSGARGEWVYLRGDRHDPSRFLRFVIENA